MRRRICLAGAAVAAASLIVSVGIALAASTTAKTKKVKPIGLHCTLNISTEASSDSNTVDQPPQQGTTYHQYGPGSCRTKGFGGGVDIDTFTIPDSGDMVGTYVQYFHAGSIKGSFDLTPNQDTVISSSSFAAQSWTGTFNVTGGTGMYQGIKMYKVKHHPVVPGVINCTSPDSVHLTCTDSVRVMMVKTFTLVAQPTTTT